MAENTKSVLVTGGNGFIASHILHQLLDAGYNVTASVRSPAKADQLISTNPAWKDRVHFEYVPDLAAPDAFDKLLDSKPYNYIIHTASPVTFQVNDIVKDLVNPAVQGTVGIIRAAHRLQKGNLKRVVLLGSAVAVLNSFDDDANHGGDYSEADWNPVTIEDATRNKDDVLGYIASKKYAEKAAWDFMNENKPSFDLTVLNPDVVIGPMLHPVPSLQSVNETNKFAIYNFLNGTYKRVKDVKFPFYHFVDVRDVAKAHVLAITAPLASNKRILLVSGVITPQLIANTIRAKFPELKARVEEGNAAQVFPDGVNSRGWDVSRSYEVFGKDWSYRGLEESVTDTVQDILRREPEEA